MASDVWHIEPQPVTPVLYDAPQYREASMMEGLAALRAGGVRAKTV